MCLHPLRNYVEALPIKMFEYMLAGLPVIASDFPLRRKIIEANECGICIDPGDSKEIAKAVEYLIEHPDEARGMGENGRRAVLVRYNWGLESRKLSRIYGGLSGK